MKQITEQMIDDILKLKFGKVVEESGHRAFVSNKTLSKIFKMSEHKMLALAGSGSRSNATRSCH